MRRLPPLQEQPDYMERVLRSFWVRSWSEDRDVHTVEDITAVGRAAGMQESQIQRCLQLMATPAVKSKLKVIKTIGILKFVWIPPGHYFVHSQLIVHWCSTPGL